MKKHTERFSNWFNQLDHDRQLICFISFCLTFTVLIALSLRYSYFDAKIYNNPVPQHIGKSTDSLMPKKH